MGKCEYHFVEVMACPSGCLNGGGQLKPPEGMSRSAYLAYSQLLAPEELGMVRTGQTVSQLIEELEVLYHREDSVWIRSPQEARLVKGLERALAATTTSTQEEQVRALFHTQYHHRTSSNATISSW
eukprot:scaffold673_cov410-Prasinococcus_capsulatus_cf.AAC.7